MIIDCHGHYTTAPAAHNDWRDLQKTAFRAGGAAPAYPAISDDEIRETLEQNQLRLLRERGADMTIFSPRASAMAHHVGDEAVSIAWARANNDLIARCVALYPEVFAGVCMLPQSPKADLSGSIAELERCVTGLGFIGCNLNPDPGRRPFHQPAAHRPFLVSLLREDGGAGRARDDPRLRLAAIPALHATGAYYIAADTIAFMQLIEGNLFADFPTLRFIIPHGGGAVPYHWGRYRGLADMLKQPSLDGHVMNNVWFDTCVYHQPGIDLLADVIDTRNILFGSEMVGAVRGIDPQTGHYFDDTKRYVDALDITEAQKHAIFEGNARRVFPRLDAKLKERGL